MIVGALFIGLSTVGFVAYGLRLRGRLAQIGALPSAPPDEVGKSYELVVADGVDVRHAAMTALNLLWMDPHRPWATNPPSVFSPLRRALAIVLAPPVLVVTFGFDIALRPFMRRRSNVYRILARKDPG